MYLLKTKDANLKSVRSIKRRVGQVTGNREQKNNLDLVQKKSLKFIARRVENKNI